MKKIFTFLMMLITLTSFSQYQDTIYINPEYSGNSDGTISKPYKNWGDWDMSRNTWTVSDNTVYLQKRGTKCTLGRSMLSISSDESNNFKFGAYGIGKKPIIYNNSNTKKRFLKTKYASNYIIENLIFENDTTQDGQGLLNMLGFIEITGGNNILIDSCEFYYSGGHHIMVGGQPDSFRIMRCIMDRSYHYATLLGVGNDFEIGYCKITNTSYNWKFGVTNQGKQPGACIGIQSDYNDNYWIHHNYCDRSNSGGKMAITVQPGSGGGEFLTGIIEYNTIITPRQSIDANGVFQGGVGIDVRNRAIGTIIRYNTITGEVTGIYNSSRATEIYGNILYNINLKGESDCLRYHNSYSGTIYNNVFYNVGNRAIIVRAADIKNNIFINIENYNHVIATSTSNEWTSDYNCYYNCEPEEDIHYITEYPEFVDTLNNDFHLKSNSPCIDAGTDVGLTVDKDGTSLPQRNGFDMGVYEYINTTPNIPLIVLDSVYNIGINDAYVSSNITSNGGLEITGRGVILNNDTITNGYGSGHFITHLTNLDDNSTYNIYPYAINQIGIGVGESVDFTTLSLITSDTIYIDPTYVLNGDGSMLNPFTSWDDIHFDDLNGKTVLQKRGTTMTIIRPYVIHNGYNILFGSYGNDEENPIIKCRLDSNIYGLTLNNCKNITLQNLHFSLDTTEYGFSMGRSGIHVWGYWNQDSTNSNDYKFINLEMKRGVYGFRLEYARNILIDNCDIHIYDRNGIYGADIRNLEIRNCDIYDGSQWWFTRGHLENVESTGDGITLVGRCSNW